MSNQLKLIVCQFDERVVVDHEHFVLNFDTDPPKLDQEAAIFAIQEGEHLGLSEDDLLLCPYLLPCFSLQRKLWYQCHVELIQEIEFSTNAFDALVLSSDKKDIISSLLQTSSKAASPFDDLIGGKGKGITFLLHGPPGVGKTFTAGIFPLLYSGYVPSC